MAEKRACGLRVLRFGGFAFPRSVPLQQLRFEPQGASGGTFRVRSSVRLTICVLVRVGLQSSRIEPFGNVQKL